MSTQELELSRLEPWLRTNVPGFDEPLSAEKFPGGQSNPTFKLTAGEHEYVLRRKPPGELLASSSPGGLRRNTYSCSPAVSLKVGFDCPPGNFSALSGSSKPGTLVRSQGSSRESSSSCVLMTDLYDVMLKRLFRTVARSGIRSQVLA